MIIKCISLIVKKEIGEGTVLIKRTIIGGDVTIVCSKATDVTFT